MTAHDEILQALGLARNPFPVGAIREGYFTNRAAADALRELAFGISARKGFLVLIGEAGVGKTTLLYQLLDSSELSETDTAFVCHSLLSGPEILRAVAVDLGLSVPAAAGPAEVLTALQARILDGAARGRNLAVIVDEAHTLEREALEALRMLSNVEADGVKLVQIVLSGQPELALRLAEPGLRQLRGRIGVQVELAPLARPEIGPYVDYRLAGCGSPLRLVPAALEMLVTVSAGNIRMINLLMERALYALALDHCESVDVRHMRAAIRDVGRCQSEVLLRLRARGRTRAFALAAAFAALPLLLLLFAWARQDSRLTAALTGGNASAPVLSQERARRAVYADQSAFLHAAGLDSLRERLDSALALDDPDVLRKGLPPGRELVRLEARPDRDVPGLTLLGWRALAGSGPAYVAVWKPPFMVREFYPGYRGPETWALQKALHRAGFLDQDGDGTVGAATWKAVAACQKSYGLPVTGQPDPETIFRLTALTGGGK